MEKPSKSELLNQLKIDRSVEPETVSLSVNQGILIGVVAAVVGALLTYLFVEAPVNSESSIESTIESSAPETETQAQQAQQQSNAETQLPETILNASGYITARRIATVSAEIMGLIKEVNVEEGMFVSKGQILARLDDSIAKVDVKLAKAQVESAIARNEISVATLAEAKRQYQRTFTNKFSSEADKTRAITDVDTANANLVNTQAAIEVARFQANRQQERLDDHSIRAPFNGVVTIKNAQPGEIVSPSSAGGGFTRTGICTVVDMDSLEIEVDVNESFIGRVYADQKVLAKLDAYPDWAIPASVIAIIPTADRGKATVKVRIRIETKDSKILPDMGVKVAFLK